MKNKILTSKNTQFLETKPGAEFTKKQNAKHYAKQIAKHFAWPSALGAIGIHKTLLS